ncbi:hypothetical protein B0H10DRAFT_2206905 [Mycena sp. CBHHK59/15]|nr:hypothetical protein B0H10DRAFT_2206905 [Mycena sp. CBHHK59/15]
MLFTLATITAAVAIVTLNLNGATAQDSGGLSDQQQCILNCSLAAVVPSGCDIEDTACVCASATYASSLTQCATTTCGVSADDVKSMLADGCSTTTSASASASGAASASTPPSSASNPASASVPLSSGASKTASASKAGSTSGSQPSASNSNSASTPSGSGAPNSATGERRIGGATVVAASLVFYALLV